MSRKPVKAPPLPGQVTGSLLGYIRKTFVPHFTGQQWGQWDDWFLREIVTWPAAFMRKKGFALPVERYEKVMLQVFSEIRSHGDTSAVNFWPGYLQKCVKSHFGCQWEKYHAEAKSASALADATLIGLGKLTDATSERQTEAIATAHSVLMRAKREKTRKPEGTQLSLL